MNKFSELIETADRLCKNLSEAANDEMRLSVEMQLALDGWSRDTWLMKRNLEDMAEYLGV